MYDENWKVTTTKITTEGLTPKEQTQFNLVSDTDQAAFITFDWMNPNFYPVSCDAGAPDLNIIIANAEGGS